VDRENSKLSVALGDVQKLLENNPQLMEAFIEAKAQQAMGKSSPGAGNALNQVCSSQQP